MVKSVREVICIMESFDAVSLLLISVEETQVFMWNMTNGFYTDNHSHTTRTCWKGNVCFSNFGDEWLTRHDIPLSSFPCYYRLSIYCGHLWHDKTHRTKVSTVQLRPDYAFTSDTHIMPSRASFHEIFKEIGPWFNETVFKLWLEECLTLKGKPHWMLYWDKLKIVYLKVTDYLILSDLSYGTQNNKE